MSTNRNVMLGFWSLWSVWSLGGGLSRAEPVHLDRVTPSLVVQRPGLYPETIEYDRKHNRFLLGSFREGAVYTVDAHGATSILVDDPRLCSVLGLAVDVERGRLWVVSADLGSATRPSLAGPRKLAAVGVYELATGAPLGYHDLAALVPGPHLLNGIAVDAAGNAYVTDSFSPVIYKLTVDGKATILARDPRFAGEGVNLNGLVVHPNGYLLVVKKSDGALFKIPLDHPALLSRVAAPALVGGDGVVLVDQNRLVVISNRTSSAVSDAASVLTSDDNWSTAKLVASLPLGDVYPTTAVVRDGKIYVVHSKLNELLGAPPEKQALLRRQAEIEQIGVVEAPTPGIRRTLLGREPARQPGWETRLYLIEYPPGAKGAPHLHPEPGVGWVVEGEFESAFAGQPVIKVKAGQSFVEQAGLAHLLFRNPSPDHPLRFVVAYTLRSVDEPFRLLP